MNGERLVHGYESVLVEGEERDTHSENEERQDQSSDGFVTPEEGEASAGQKGIVVAASVDDSDNGRQSSPSLRRSTRNRKKPDRLIAN